MTDESKLRVQRDTRNWHIWHGKGWGEMLICTGAHAKDEPCDFYLYRYVGRACEQQARPTD